MVFRGDANGASIAMDTATSDIRAVEFTPGRGDSRPATPARPDDEDIGTVTADGAYDSAAATAPIARGGTPSSRSARWRVEGGRPAARARNETPRAHLRLRPGVPDAVDGFTPAAAPRPRCAASSPSARARRPRETQTAKPARYLYHRVALINRFDALGTAEIGPRGLNMKGKGKSRLKPPFCNDAIPNQNFVL